MTQNFTINGMTCQNCESKVKQALNSIEGVSNVDVSRDLNKATITSQKEISLHEVRKKIEGLGSKYSVTADDKINAQVERTWIETYKPVLLIFAFITAVTFVIDYTIGAFSLHRWMRHFMAGFFLVFSFFKLLNIKGFAESYAMYDVIAKRFPIWGYIYAFIELGLGFAFLMNIKPLWINVITLMVMSISIIGVLQTVLNKKKIKCACLGDVFNLPMSTVTIIEDGLMILMSCWMLLTM